MRIWLIPSVRVCVRVGGKFNSEFHVKFLHFFIVKDIEKSLSDLRARLKKPNERRTRAQHQVTFSINTDLDSREEAEGQFATDHILNGIYIYVARTTFYPDIAILSLTHVRVMATFKSDNIEPRHRKG